MTEPPVPTLTARWRVAPLPLCLASWPAYRPMTPLEASHRAASVLVTVYPLAESVLGAVLGEP